MFTLNNNFKFYKNYFLKNYIPLFSKREKNYISVENEFLILKNKIQQQKKILFFFLIIKNLTLGGDFLLMTRFLHYLLKQ